MSFDRLLHRLKCRFFPVYKKERVAKTKEILDHLEKSKILVMERIEQSLLIAEHTYSRVVTSDMTSLNRTKLHDLERRLTYHRFVLEELKKGKRLDAIDQKLLATVLSMLEE